jgi:hypothetical protein
LKTFPYLCLLTLIFFISNVNAQQRCATSDRMKQVLNADPVAKARFENTQKSLDEKVKQVLSDPNYKLFKTNAIVTVPVVIHIMYSNPSQVTDAIVQRQLDTLNKYYGAAPSNDSLRVYAPFRTSYGRSQIRFCLAQRTPTDQPTTGIDRTVSSFDPNGFPHPSTVVSAWNTNKYLNIWVVDFGGGGTLGYSYLPGTFAAGDQRAGFVVDYRAFGSGASYLFSAYNQGKTAVHEIGHYFNLEHPWGGGDQNATCANDDFCSDTPKTDNPYGGCTTIGPVTNTCSLTAPGIMWQNHMDYAEDRCMLLFTVQQCARMDNALNAVDRAGLKTSTGCQPAIVPPNDASITSIINPANNSFACSTTLIPQVELTNAGSNTLTAVRITVTVNGVPQPVYIWSGSLLQNASTSVTLPAINLNAGVNSITIATSLPNGAADGNVLNDSKSASVNFTSTISLPLVEGFESTSFPPANWLLINPDNDFTWTRVSPGFLSQGAMFINNYDDDGTDNIDDLRSLPIQTGAVTALTLKFDVAHKYYPVAGYHDTLSVLVSGDCGNTFQTVYKKWGAALATAGSDQNAFTNPQPNEWRNETASITGAALSSGKLVVVFRNTSMFGNNIFIDNINILSPAPRDLQVVSIPAPANLICTSSISPQVEIKNQSPEIVNSFKVGVQLDNGTIIYQNFNTPINGLETVTVTLNALSVTPGNRIIKIFTTDPVSASGTGDANTSNDTLSKSFAVPGTMPSPFSESFITSTFPPVNWSIINPDNSTTWTRYGNGNGNAGSAFVKTFTYLSSGQVDQLALPKISYTDVDSIAFSFDVAASSNRFPGLPMDTLEVLVTKDCGNSFTSVYKKWGNELSTVTPGQPTEFFPLSAAQWRKENIDLSAFVANSPLLIVFKLTNNNENNVFIDNVNIQTLSLPAILKSRGLMVYPNHFASSFTIWHYRQPATLSYINIFNAVGQLVYQKLFEANASNIMTIDLGNKPKGMYIMKMGYTDKPEVIEKLIKY